MHLQHDKILIRSATIADAPLLCRWWNDGAVMAHAGFPLGLGTTEAKVAADLARQDPTAGELCILEYDGFPIGEMNYHNAGNHVADLGIKICESGHQNHGLGKQILSLMIEALFSQMGYVKICLDPNLKNTRAQHVYEQLGFQKVAVERDSWTDQLGQLQSAVLYELTPPDFHSYL